MSAKSKVFSVLYKNFFKRFLFLFDAEWAHNNITRLGESLEKSDKLVSGLFSYQNKKLHKKILGINFANPIGLAAGFDYDGHLAEVMKYVGFGFNTVGSVTALPYEGNPRPRLARLPKSRSLLVNKGFKSEGAKAVAARLDKKNLNNHTVGVSIGSTNSPKIKTVNQAIDDYLFTFNLFKTKSYIKYFELNISCPNTAMTESFTNKDIFYSLIKEISSLKIRQPIFVKMPNEIGFEQSDQIVNSALKYGIRGFIFSNLVKDRNNPALDRDEVKKISQLKGNFSGKPTAQNANKLMSHTRKKFGSEIVIIGCGGIFTVEDAIEKFRLGADLAQLITGMIFEGPQLIGELCEGLADSAIFGKIRQSRI